MKQREIRYEFQGYNLVLVLTLLFSQSFAQYTWVDTTDTSGNIIRMKVNDKTGAPHRLYGLDVNFSHYGHITEQNVQGLSRQFLTEHAKLLKIQPGALKLESAKNRNGRWYVNFQQQYRGILVYRANIGFTIHENGNVVLVGSDAYPDISIDATPSISSDEALHIAQSNFAGLSGTDSVEIRKEPELIILPVENDTGYDYFLTYNIELEFIDSLSVFSEAYFIEANTGSIVKQYSNLVHARIYGTVNIRYWPEHYYDSAVTTNSKYNKVRVVNLLGQEVGSDHTDASGYYNVNFSGSYGLYFLRSPFEGNWVRLRNTSYQHTYTFWYTSNTLHNWTHTLNDASNVYHHVNKIHGYFKNSPFNYGGMDYRMNAYINEGPYYNGWSNGIDIGFGSQNGQYWARSSDVIYHEYTHSTIYHLYGNQWIGSGNTQAGAMNEGLPDYFACTMNDDNVQGESVGVNRDLLNNLTWNQSAGMYENGRVIGGACWDLHELLRNDPATGIIYVDNLVFEALQMTPHAYDFEDFAENIAVADDDDGNPNNSVPHYYEIKEAFETNHGITLNVPPPPPPLSVYISGPFVLGYKQFGTFTANVTGGIGTIYYQWYRKDDGGSWQTRGTSQSQTERMVRVGFTMKVVVTRGSETDEATKYCEYEGGGGGDPRPKIAALPETYNLSQNHPNPFNPVTTIRYALPEASKVTVVIYNLSGNEIAKWVMDHEQAGYKQIVWNGKNQNSYLVSAGIYIYHITASSIESDKRFAATRKMVLLK